MKTEILLYSLNKKRLLTISEIWNLFKINNYSYYHISSFLPKSYWQKRGLNLLLNNRSIAYIQLPESYEGSELPETNEEDFLKCFNPIKIATELFKARAEWLPFYIKQEFGVELPKSQNPFVQKECFIKIIKKKFSILNHSSKNDIAAQFQMPMRTILISLKQFPDKLEKVKEMLKKLQSDFFNNYEVAQLLFLLDGYLKQFDNEIDTVSIKFMNFNNSLINCKEITLNYFDKEILNNNLQVLEELNINFIAMKND